ncbi:MAG: DnaD domain protein [Clostridia bacterium]|nr:DnaD domain protein [Clostridia bacterium]
MKKYKIKYGEHTVTLPADIVRHLAEADADELKALILIAAAGDEKPDIDAAGMTEKDFEAAASFLRGAGLITSGSKGSSAKNKAPKKKDEEKTEKTGKRSVKLVRREILPEYTASEISDMMRENRLLASLIDACQHTLGKVFNAAENNVIITLNRQLGLDGEYILLLLAYCAEKDKKNLTYIQRMAADLVEKGVLTPPQLEEELVRRDEAKSGEGALRKMFGIGSRSLTKKESEIFTLWICDRKHSMELIKEAYERTVAKAGKASVPYCNTILEDWFANGIKTPEEARAAAEGKKTAAQVRGSFETDDFFGAALNRSMAGLGEK